MTTKLAFNLLAVSCLTMAPTFAQSSNTQEDKSAKTRSVTGCLTAGDSANEFKLTQDDGSTWEIQSKGVKLSPHVGHTVAVTGKVRQADMHGIKEKSKEAVNPNAKEQNAHRVTHNPTLARPGAVSRAVLGSYSQACCQIFV